MEVAQVLEELENFLNSVNFEEAASFLGNSSDQKTPPSSSISTPNSIATEILRPSKEPENTCLREHSTNSVATILEPSSHEEVALYSPSENIGQEVNVEFPIERWHDRDLMEPIIDAIVESTIKMVIEKPEATNIVSLSSSPVTLAKNPTQNIGGGLKDKRKIKTSQVT